MNIITYHSCVVQLIIAIRGGRVTMSVVPVEERGLPCYVMSNFQSNRKATLYKLKLSLADRASGRSKVLEVRPMIVWIEM